VNRYKPYYDPDERIVGMEIDNDGSWVHISEVRKLKDEVEKLREYAQERALLYSQSLEAAEAEVARLRANIEQWEEVVKDAFYDGFWAPATYIDTILNEVDAEWEEYKQSPIYKAALDAARGES